MFDASQVCIKHVCLITLVIKGISLYPFKAIVGKNFVSPYVSTCSLQIREELRANGIDVYPQKEFDEDAEDRMINEKIRVRRSCRSTRPYRYLCQEFMPSAVNLSRFECA